MKSILLIEDDPTIGDLMHEFLAGEGCSIHVARNGAEALPALLAGQKPDLIFLDSNMPVMSGAQFMREFKKLPHPQTDIPVYLFSAGDAHAESKALGCTGYLKKPVDLVALRSIIHAVAEKRPRSSDNPR